MRVQTHSVHFHADARLHDHIQKRLEKLTRVNDRIEAAEVFLKLENSGQVRDKVVEVRLKMPGAQFFEKKTSKTFEAAIDNVARSLRQLVVRDKEKAVGGRKVEARVVADVDDTDDE